MKDYLRYINTRFPDELKLIIHLSQVEINESEISDLAQHINWDLFLSLLSKHRLVSHIYRHIELIESFAPKDISEKLKQTKLDQSGRSLHYTVFLVRIYKQLKEKGIAHCFFKGPLLSFELYHDVGFRNFGDIDILVDINDVERARKIIEEFDFTCIYPKIKLTDIQRNVNYSISHHYHFKNKGKNIDIELHWSITNPKSFFGVATSDIISRSETINVSNTELPYISKTDNLVYLAAHGSIHQWYRLFWLKDFSVLLAQADSEEIEIAWKLAEKLQLRNCFLQACWLSKIFYKTELPYFLQSVFPKKVMLAIPLKSIYVNELKQQGVFGKFKYVFYRLRLKPSFRYYADLIFRLRTHLSDWEMVKLPDTLFFLYYFLRPFLLFFRMLKKNRKRN